MKFKSMKKALSVIVVACLVSVFSVQCVEALTAAEFRFVFNGASGDIYDYTEAMLKKNDSSSYVYYATGDANISMSVVGYDGTYIENIPLAEKNFQPGQTGYVNNWIIESGLKWGCLRGEATTDSLYYGSGAWNIDS